MDTIDWLLDSDPAIRWQAMRDLADAPAPAVARLEAGFRWDEEFGKKPFFEGGEVAAPHVNASCL